MLPGTCDKYKSPEDWGIIEIRSGIFDFQSTNLYKYNSQRAPSVKTSTAELVRRTTWVGIDYRLVLLVLVD